MSEHVISPESASEANKVDYSALLDEARASELAGAVLPPPNMPGNWKPRLHPLHEAKELMDQEATYTISARQIAEFEGSFRPADEHAPHGYYRDLPILGRDSVRINGGIDVVGKIVIDDKNDRSLAEAAARFDYSRDRSAKKDIDKLQEVYRFTRSTLRYDLEASEAIRSRSAKGLVSPNEPLGTYIDAGVGVCQMQSMLAAYLTERLVDNGELKGRVSLNRKTKHAEVGHEWMVWEPENGEELILDPARNSLGSRSQAEQDDSKWYDKQPTLTDQDKSPSVANEKRGLPVAVVNKDYLLRPPINDRQQRKIVALLHTGNLSLISTSDGDFDATTGEKGRASVIKTLARIDNLAPYANNLVSHIQPDHERADFSLTETFAELQHAESDPNMQTMAVLAIMRGKSISSRTEMRTDDLKSMVAALPDVVAFEAHANLLIENIFQDNGQAKADEYALAATRLSHAVYGKQKEYWDQFRILYHEARNTPFAPEPRWRIGRRK